MAIDKAKLRKAALEALQRRNKGEQSEGASFPDGTVDGGNKTEKPSSLKDAVSAAASEALKRRKTNREESSFGITKDEIQEGGVWKKQPSVFPTPDRWDKVSEAQEDAVKDGVLTPKEYGTYVRTVKNAASGDAAVEKSQKKNFENKENSYSRKSLLGADIYGNDLAVYAAANLRKKRSVDAKIQGKRFELNNTVETPENREYLLGLRNDIEVLQAEKQGYQDKYDLAEALYKEDTYLPVLKQYESVVNNDDFAVKSKFVKKGVEYSPNAIIGSFSISDEDAHLYNFVNKDQEAINVNDNLDINVGKSVPGNAYDNNRRYLYMDDAEVAIFNYLFVTKGPDEAKKYIETLEDYNDALRSSRILTEKEHDKQVALEHPIGSSVYTILTSPQTAYRESAAILAGGLDNNSASFRTSRQTGTIRGTVEENIDSDVGKFFYRHGMSLGDNVVRMAAGGGNEALTLAPALMQSFNSTALDAKARGLSDEQAISLGTIAAGAEYFFESKSFDALFNGGSLPKSGWKYFINNVKTEAVGEVGTDVANDVADVFVSQDYSKWMLDVKAYKAEGYSNSEAWNMAFNDRLLGYLDTAVGSVFSSGGMAAPGVVASTYNNYKTDVKTGEGLRLADGEVLTADDIADFVYRAAEKNDGSDAYKFADKLKKNIDKGNQISSYQIGHLYNLLESEADTGVYAEDEIAVSRDGGSPSEAIRTTADEAVSSTVERLTSASAVDKAISGAASSAEINTISKDAGLRAEFTEKTGVNLSSVPSEARSQMRTYIAERASNIPSENSSEAVSAVEEGNSGTNGTAEDAVTKIIKDIQNGGDGVSVLAKEYDAVIDETVSNIVKGTGTDADLRSVASKPKARLAFYKQTGIKLTGDFDNAYSRLKEYADGKASASSEASAEYAVPEYDSIYRGTQSDGDSVAGSDAESDDVSVNDGVAGDSELTDYAVDDGQASLENAVAKDEQIVELQHERDNGEITEEQFTEAVNKRVNEIEAAMDDGDASVVVTDNGEDDAMSKEDFDVVRNNSFSITRSSAKEIRASSVLSGVSDADIRAFRAVGKALGVEVKAFDGKALGLTGTDGAYDPQTRTVYLNTTNPMKAISSAFRHEVIHYLKASSPKAFGEFAVFVIDRYKAQYGADAFDAWLKAKREEYANRGTTLDNDGAIEEFLAQYGMDMLQQKAIARDFVREHRDAATKVFEFIREFINKIRRFFGMNDLPSSVNEAIMQLSENASGGIQVDAKGYTRSYLNNDNTELMPENLSAEDLMKADRALLEAFVEVAEINKRVQAKLKNAPADVLNDDVKRAEYIDELWAEETGVAPVGDADVKFGGKDVSPEEMAKTRFNLAAVESHKKKLEEKFNAKASEVSEEQLKKRYAMAISLWEGVSDKLKSKYLNKWNNLKGKDRAFTVFKAQSGYKYTVELSSKCRKGLSVFEAIDEIVKDEAMKRLDTDVIGKEEKEILYEILREKGFEIPCAICYVEQARQREGAIIKAFLDGKVEKTKSGKVTTYKLGWNETLHKIEDGLKAKGIDYIFPAFDRSIATDNYTASEVVMPENVQNAFYEVLVDITNAEIERYNAESTGKTKYAKIKDSSPSSVNAVLKGNLPLNLAMLKTLFNETNSRMTIDEDLLYSSMVTHNLAYNNQMLYSVFNRQGGTGGYKTKQNGVVYWGDVLSKGYAPGTVRREGGIRGNSNSDFEMHMFLDYAQMYIDYTAKGYYAQEYSKVISKLKLFGLSGIKLNASLIPKVKVVYKEDGTVDVEKTRERAGLDENGILIFDDFEGANHAEVFMLTADPVYSKNVGAICVGYSDAHISALLDDNRIQQIIGFHDKTDNPDKRYSGAKFAKNYNGLNEATKKKDGETVHIGFNQFVINAEKMFGKNKADVEFGGKTYSWNDVPKLAADLYLKHCEDNKLNPAYSQNNGTDGIDFSKHPNYYKLLADFSLYDSKGNYAPHSKVAFNLPGRVPILNPDGSKTFAETGKYIEKQLKSELAVRDDLADALADKSENGIVEKFVKKVNEDVAKRNADADTGVKFSKAKVDNGEDSGYNDDTNFVKDGVKDAKTSDDGRTVQTEAVFSRGIHGVYDGNRDNARGNTDNSADLSVGNTAVELHSSDNKSSQTRTNTERSGGKPSLGTLYSAKSSSQESGTGTYERGYREAVESNNLETARKILDEYAERKDFVPVNVYHGTSSQSVFTEFKNNGKAVWVTPNLEYAGSYSEGYYGNDIKAEQLFTEPDSAIFDLYFKPGKTLDVGYINKEVKSGNDLAEFANKIGVDLMDIMPAWINGRKTYEDNRLWVITISREFADLARKLGYDSLKAVEGNVNNGITTYGILYPENVKSSKTVTYDNDGNIIPLSERFNTKNKDVRWSKASSGGKVDTFYSKMAKEIDNIKQDKIGANSVVPYLTGRGVKAEEIKWSGVEEFLEGKKSVTKEELQEFVRNNNLKIEEETLDDNEIPYTDEQNAKISQYKANHDAIMDELMTEWKTVTGTNAPFLREANIDNFDIVRMIDDLRQERIDATSEGARLAELREKVKEMIAANDDFGFDRTSQAFRSITRNPENFDMSEEDANLVREYIEAKKNANEVGEKFTISEQDSDKLKNLAYEAKRWSEKISDIKFEHYAENAKHTTKWGQYKLDGGENYREYLFKMSGSEYYNQAMSQHWGEREGILAHARVQDFDVDGKKMLFIEEIQSDWHNEGQKKGYAEGKTESASGDAVPDAPFRNNYQEYVLKRLIRMAAEEGYDSIGWTTADIQSERWSDEYAEGYHIEYDQDIPKFLNKYGKKWDAKVGKTNLGDVDATEYTIQLEEGEAGNGEVYHSEKDAIAGLVEYVNDTFGTDFDAENAVVSADFGNKIVITDEFTDIEIGVINYKDAKGSVKIWSMPITESMKDSVLYEGQPMYSFSKPDSSESETDNTKYIPKGEKPARDIDVPAFDDKGKPVARHIRTVLEAKATPEKYVSHIMEDVAKGNYVKDVITDEDAKAYVDRYLSTHSYEQAYDRIISTVGALDKNDTALAQHLYNEAVNHINFLNSMDADGVAKIDKLLVKMVKSASEAGRTLQAQRMLKRLSPAGMLWDVTSEVQRITDEMNAELGKWVEDENAGVEEGKRVKGKDEVSSLGNVVKGKKYHKKQKPLVINPDLRQKLLEAKNLKEAEAARDELVNDLALQILPRFSEKLSSFRYIAMLANPRTHIRNILGNAVFSVGINARNFQSAILEPKLVKQEDRRNTLVFSKERKAKQKELRTFAEGIFETYEDQVKGESRYGSTVSSMLDEHKVIFRGKYLGKVLEGIRNKNFKALEAEDMWFLKSRFVKTFANAALARGYAVADFGNGKVSDKQFNELLRYAAIESQKATYRDASAAADILNKISKEHAVAGFILDGVVPFKKTPINVMKRGIEYSPISIIKGIAKLGKQSADYLTHKSDYIDSAEIIKLITQGTTGTGLLVIGYLLAQAGLLKGGDEDEDKLNDLKEARGEQTYSIELEIGGKRYSFTLDWAAPLCMPLFVGTELSSMVDGEFDVNDLLPSLANIATPILDTSMMSGVMDLIDTVKYSDGSDMVSDVMASVASSYALQFFPSFTAAIGRTIDDVDSRTSTTDKTGTEGMLERFKNRIYNKSIIARTLFKKFGGYNAPYTDTFGGYKKKETAGDYALSALQNFVLPGYITEVTDTETTSHMMGLFESTAELSMVPGYVNKITVDGESKRLTNNEIFDYKQRRGEHYSAIVPELTSAEWYNALDDGMKVDVLTAFKELSDADCKHMIYSEYYPNDKRMKAVIDGGFDTEDVIVYLQGEMVDALAGDEKKATELGVIMNLDISEEAKMDIYRNMFSEGNDEWKEEKADISALEKVGIDFDGYLECKIKKSELDSDDSLKGSDKATQFAVWAHKKFDDDAASVVKETFTFFNFVPAEAKRFTDLHDSGMSIETSELITNTISGLSPLAGADEVSNRQKVLAIDGIKGISNADKNKAYSVILTDAEYERVDAVGRLKVDYNTYYDIVDIYDKANDAYSDLSKDEQAGETTKLKNKYGLGKNQAYAYLAIEKHGSGLSSSQKAALWQMFNKTWSADNNPYGSSAGASFKKAMGWE